jgi:small nuclear ribonucleoprotein (snRNP)-like protein
MTVAEYIDASLSAIHNLIDKPDFIEGFLIAIIYMTLLIAYALIEDPLKTQYKVVAFILIFVAFLKAFENYYNLFLSYSINYTYSSVPDDENFHYTALAFINAYIYDLLINTSFLVFLIPAVIYTYRIILANSSNLEQQEQVANKLKERAKKVKENKENEENKEKEEIIVRDNPVI